MSRSEAPEKVQVSMEIQRVWHIDEKNETFCAEVKVATRWICPKKNAQRALAAGGDELDIAWRPEWYPSFDIEDAVPIIEPVNRYVAKEAADGTVWIKGMSTITVTISEPFDLRAFPFDFQDINIMVIFDNVAQIEPWFVPLDTFVSAADESRGFLARDEVVLDGGGVAESEQRRRTRVQALRDGLNQPDFELIEGSPVYRYSEQGSAAASLHVLGLFERNPHYYVSNVLALMFGIKLCSVAVWSIDAVQDHDSRLALDFTLLLVAVAFKQVANNDMPELSYLTLLDLYLIACILFLFTATWIHAGVGIMMRWCEASAEPNGCEEVTRWDTLLLWLYVAALAIFNIGYVAYVGAQVAYSHDVAMHAGHEQGWQMAHIVKPKSEAPHRRARLLKRRPTRVPLSYMSDLSRLNLFRKAVFAGVFTSSTPRGDPPGDPAHKYTDLGKELES